jgi:hypothetical protein
MRDEVISGGDFIFCRPVAANRIRAPGSLRHCNLIAGFPGSALETSQKFSILQL